MWLQMYILKVKSFYKVLQWCKRDLADHNYLLGEFSSFPRLTEEGVSICSHVWNVTYYCRGSTEIHGSELTPVVIIRDRGRGVRIHNGKGTGNGVGGGGICR